jgi:hypothetical protein
VARSHHQGSGVHQGARENTAQIGFELGNEVSIDALALLRRPHAGGNHYLSAAGIISSALRHAMQENRNLLGNGGGVEKALSSPGYVACVSDDVVFLMADAASQFARRDRHATYQPYPSKGSVIMATTKQKKTKKSQEKTDRMQQRLQHRVEVRNPAA